MKVKELITELQKCDGDSEVVVDGDPIYFIEELPGYYDGYYSQLIQDKTNKYYNIEGVRFTRAGKKVRLNVFSASEVLWNCLEEKDLEKVKIEYDKSLHNSTKESIEKYIEKTKEEVLKFYKERKGE